jgi:hypothetical protein
MPINVTVNSIADLIDQIRAVNNQPNNADEHMITLHATNFPATAQITSAASGAGGDADLFGLCAFPVVRRNLKIVGNGKTLAMSGISGVRHFAINGKQSGSTYAKLTLENLGLSNGVSTGGGGSIINDGTPSAPSGTSLVIRRCYFILNSGNVNGGVLYNGDGAKCAIFESIFTNNTAAGINARGGVIYNSSGSTLIIRDSTFANNLAPGTGSLGGAIFIYSGSVDIKNSSFVGNTAAGIGTPSMTVYHSAGSLDASWNWWGGVAVSGAPQPALTTLPRFFRPGSYPTTPYLNPSLPPESQSCSITAWNGAILRSGPSDDDTDVTNLLYPNLPVKARARATDEAGNNWVGFSHPDTARQDYLTWVRVGTGQATVSPANCNNSLPDFNTQPNNSYSPSLLITTSPLRAINQTPPTIDQKGFGVIDPLYNNLPGSRHPGFDFFAPSPTSNVQILAVTGGIVVGIGRAQFPTLHPATWGTTEGGFNLIVRTDGYFLLYGHLASIDPSIYLGARVGPGAVLGTLWDQGSNTHLHLEVRTFRHDNKVVQMAATLPQNERPLRCRFGAIIPSASANATAGHPKPRLATDPMKFVVIRGTPGTTSDPAVRKYTGALLSLDGEVVTFNYRVQIDLDQKSFDLFVTPLAPLTPPAPVGPQYCP